MATLSKRFHRRWDGTRVLAISDEEVTLQNRHGIIYTLRLPDVVKALQQIPAGKWILDGEIVYVNPSTGREEFTSAQRRCATQVPSDYFTKQVPVKYEIFDVLEADGVNVERKPYFERKDILHKLWACNIDEPTVEYVSYDSDLQKAWTDAVEQERVQNSVQ